MKLATALSKRSDLQKRVSELSNRLNNNAKVQDGQKPSENPAELLKELDSLLVQLEDLVSRINLANANTLCDGRTLTELLSRRDALKLRNTVMRSFLDAASHKVDRYSKTEIIVNSTVEVAALQKDVDKLSRELRELDEKIQELNWTTELAE